MTKKEVLIKARLLQNKLGKGWKIKVWGNLGWQYHVEKGCISVMPSGSDSEEYWCLISDNIKDASFGTSAFNYSFQDKDPQKVVLEGVKIVKKYFNKISTINDFVINIKKEFKKQEDRL